MDTRLRDGPIETQIDDMWPNKENPEFFITFPEEFAHLENNSVTFSLKAWKGKYPPTLHQWVILKNIVEFGPDKKLRANIANPV